METTTILQNRYEIEKQIGEGGMGTVFIATDKRFNTKVAVKKTLFADENLLKAFEREAQLLNGLRHPALPRVSDYFTEDNEQFLVMEYIAGKDLLEVIKRDGAFSVAEVLRWADTLLDALDYLHTQKVPVVHRDIKPQNLKLTARGEIILLDFGLAKGSASEVTQATEAKSVFGFSLIYAPLEQIQGAGTDPRSDLYALAATLYHLMTGSAPVDALTRATAVLAQQPDPLRPPHAINSAIPVAVSKTLVRAMALNPQARPANAKTLRTQLIEAAPVKPGQTAGEFAVTADTVIDKPRSTASKGATTVVSAGRAPRPKPGATTVVNAPAVSKRDTTTVVSARARAMHPKTRTTIAAPPINRLSANNLIIPPSTVLPLVIAAAILLFGGGGFAVWYGTSKTATAQATATPLPQQANVAAAESKQTIPVIAAESNTSTTSANAAVVQPVQPTAVVSEPVKTTSVAANTPVQIGEQTAAPVTVAVQPTQAAAPPAPTVDTARLEQERREQEKREQEQRREQEKREQARRLEDETRNSIEQMHSQMSPANVPAEVRSAPERMRPYIDQIYQENLNRIRELNRRRVDAGMNAIPEPPAPRHPPMPHGRRPF